MTNVQPLMNEISIDDYALRLAEIKEQKDSLTKEEGQIKLAIKDRYAEEIAAKLKEKDEPFGVVNIEEGDKVIAVTTPKKVKWDQTKLATLVQQITAGGEDPLQYIKIEYDVPEAKFKAWPDVIRQEFLDARTVEPGSIAIVIKEKGE